MSHLPYYGESEAPPSEEHLAAIRAAEQQRVYRKEFEARVGRPSLTDVGVVFERGPRQTLWVCLTGVVAHGAGYVSLITPVRQWNIDRSKYMPHRGAKESTHESR